MLNIRCFGLLENSFVKRKHKENFLCRSNGRFRQKFGIIVAFPWSLLSWNNDPLQRIIFAWKQSDSFPNRLSVLLERNPGFGVLRISLPSTMLYVILLIIYPYQDEQLLLHYLVIKPGSHCVFGSFSALHDIINCIFLFQHSIFKERFPLIFVFFKVSVPGRKTTYWCQAMKLSEVVTLSKKQHVVEVRQLNFCPFSTSLSQLRLPIHASLLIFTPYLSFLDLFIDSCSFMLISLHPWKKVIISLTRCGA